MPHKFNTARRDKIPKQKHRVTNWADYNEGLRRRGDLTIWISADALDLWSAPHRTTRGGQPRYSDLAIELCLTLGVVFHLPLRQTQGLMRSCQVGERLPLDLCTGGIMTVLAWNLVIAALQHVLALKALGGQTALQLRNHIAEGRRAGVCQKEIVEVIWQIDLHVGFIAAISILNIWMDSQKRPRADNSPFGKPPSFWHAFGRRVKTRHSDNAQHSVK